MLGAACGGEAKTRTFYNPREAPVLRMKGRGNSGAVRRARALIEDKNRCGDACATRRLPPAAAVAAAGAVPRLRRSIVFLFGPLTRAQDGHLSG